MKTVFAALSLVALVGCGDDLAVEMPSGMSEAIAVVRVVYGMDAPTPKIEFHAPDKVPPESNFACFVLGPPLYNGPSPGPCVAGLFWWKEHRIELVPSDTWSSSALAAELCHEDALYKTGDDDGSHTGLCRPGDRIDVANAALAAAGL